MHGRGLMVGLLLTLGCSEAAERVAVEDVGDADLRVVVARAGDATEVRLLAGAEAYRYAHEPLSEVFARGDALEVYVLGYTLETLAAAFPALEGRSAADVAARLTPHLDAAGPGRFVPPTPDAVLFTEVTEGGEATVDYRTRDWSQVSGEITLSFELAGDLACPPVGAIVRAFSRDAPGRVCIFSRNSDCVWSRLGNPTCANQSRIFGVDGEIVEQPDGTLLVGERRCTPTDAHAGDARRGETAAYLCGGSVVAVQAQPLDAQGALWRPRPGPSIANAEVALQGQWIPRDPGVLFAFESEEEIEVRRIGVEPQGGADFRPLAHPVIDSPATLERRASSVDGVTVTLTGTGFERNVGSVPDQCFRRVAGTRPLEWAGIESRDAQDTLTLSTALAPFDGALDWQVVGDPGQDFVMSPQPVDVRLPQGSGGLGRVSVDSGAFPAALLLHGRNRTFVFDPVTRFEGDTYFVSCPREVPSPADLVGPLIVAPDGFYGLRADGIAVLDAEGAEVRTLPSEGEAFSASWTLTRTLERQGNERVVVFREGRAHLFEPDGDIHDVVDVDGRIVGVLSGPRILYLPEGERFAVRLVSVLRGELTDEVQITVPAVSEGSPPAIEVRPEAVRDLGRTVLVGFSSGDYAGVLDVASGLSSATDVSPGAQVAALFEGDDGQQIWAAVTTSGGSVELLQLPLPAED